MSIGLIGRKVGVTQVFQGDGTMVAVSVLAIEPNTVTRLRTDARDGYTAVQLGTEESKRLNKPDAGQLKDLPQVAKIREFRVESVDDYEVGQKIAIADVFADGDLVDVTGAIGLPDGAEMIMPGDNVEMSVELITPIALEVGQRFAIREGGRTVGAGAIVSIVE